MLTCGLCCFSGFLLLTFAIASDHRLDVALIRVDQQAARPMAPKDDKPLFGREKDGTVSPPPPSDADQSKKDSPADLEGPSSLLLNADAGGLAFPLDVEAEAELSEQPATPLQPKEPVGPTGSERGELPAIRLDEVSERVVSISSATTPPLEEQMELSPPVMPPTVPQLEKPPKAAGGREDELRVILLDEIGDELAARAEQPATTETQSVSPLLATVQPLKDQETRAGDNELRGILLDDLLPGDSAPATKPSAGAAPLEAPVEKAAGSSPGEDWKASPLLIENELIETPRAEPVEESATPSSEVEYTFGAGSFEGPSSLLLGAEQATTPTAPAEPSVEAKRGRRWGRERVRVVPPKGGTQVEWYSNADACAVYCRKNRRPLLLYFTTGDVEQCQTYETAIRMEEMQPFLCSYVCCMVSLAQAEGRKVAMRLGVPTDGPAMVLLSPSGREYARVLKSEVDWRFLAAMLLWALR